MGAMSSMEFPSPYYMHLCFVLSFEAILVIRLASGVGAGGSTAKHACQIGALYGSEVFKIPG